MIKAAHILLKLGAKNVLIKGGHLKSKTMKDILVNKKSIKILEIQRQGKRPQNIGEFMLGSQIKKGSNLNNV